MAKDDATLGEQIKKAIASSGLSLNQIARESGVTDAALSYFMTGKRSLNLDSAEKLATYFGMTLTEPRKPPATPTEISPADRRSAAYRRTAEATGSIKKSPRKKKAAGNTSTSKKRAH